jgi:K+/H+ antiporter YhaU regulatory subunit KhtT
VDLPESFEISVTPLTADMIGHTVKELDIRATYGVTVVAINRRGERGERKVVTSDPDEMLKKGDMLVLIGSSDALAHLKSAFSI